MDLVDYGCLNLITDARGHLFDLGPFHYYSKVKTQPIVL